MLVEDSKGELIIIEVQNSKEDDYFQRMLYGVAKAISEHIAESQAYGDIKKVISITIAYFDLGQGEDYVYHGTTTFRGLHKNDTLRPSTRQLEKFRKENLFEICPEFWIIKVNQFSDEVQDKLDEWIYFLKNSEIKSEFSAKGLQAASERLKAMQLSEEEAQAYKYYLKRLRDIASEEATKQFDKVYAVKRGKMTVARNLLKAGLESLLLLKTTGLTIAEVQKLLDTLDESWNEEEE